ncbi:Arr3 [Lemmus lemmus]
MRKDLYEQAKQVAPAKPSSSQGPLTALGEQLLHKLGANAYPFTLQLCGVDFEVKSYCAENLNEKIPKSDSVKLVIWKVQFSPWNQALVPTHRSFPASSHQLNPNNSRPGWTGRLVIPTHILSLTLDPL